MDRGALPRIEGSQPWNPSSRHDVRLRLRDAGCLAEAVRAHRLSHTGSRRRPFGLQVSLLGGGRVLAPFAGIVVVASDRMADPSRTSLPHGIAKAHRPAQSFAREGGNAALLAGNYVVLDRGDGVFAALCHPQKGSVRVGAGDDIHEGDVLGLVGCSGNSFAPHLHFQLMDRADAVCALGLPCSFGPCEVLCSDGWRRFESRVPAKGERVRFPELPMVRGRGAPWTTSTS